MVFQWAMTILGDLYDDLVGLRGSTKYLLLIKLVGRGLKLSLITRLWVGNCCTRGFSSHQ